jgi:hypothetical protein
MTYSSHEIAEILRQLKRDLRNQRLQDEGDQSAALATALAQTDITRQVNPRQPIAWPDWPKGLLPKVVALVQKVVRRLLCWYIDPIVEEQNQFNAAVTMALGALAQENRRLRSELRMLAADSTVSDRDWDG